MKDANISDEVHMATLDMNVIIIAFLITKIICISNFLSILWKRLTIILSHKKYCRAFCDRKTSDGALFFNKTIRNLSIERPFSLFLSLSFALALSPCFKRQFFTVD